jgi:hypothetical protein
VVALDDDLSGCRGESEKSQEEASARRQKWSGGSAPARRHAGISPTTHVGWQASVVIGSAMLTAQ